MFAIFLNGNSMNKSPIFISVVFNYLNRGHLNDPLLPIVIKHI